MASSNNDWVSDCPDRSFLVCWPDYRFSPVVSLVEPLSKVGIVDPGDHHWVRIGLESSMESGDSNTALGMGKLALFYRMANCIRDIGFDRRLITMADTT